MKTDELVMVLEGGFKHYVDDCNLDRLLIDLQDAFDGEVEVIDRDENFNGDHWALIGADDGRVQINSHIAAFYAPTLGHGCSRNVIEISHVFHD